MARRIKPSRSGLNKLRALAESSITARLFDDVSAVAAIREIATALSSRNGAGEAYDTNTRNPHSAVAEGGPLKESTEISSAAQKENFLALNCGAAGRHDSKSGKIAHDGRVLAGRHTHCQYSYQTASLPGSRCVPAELSMWKQGSWPVPSRMTSSLTGSDRRVEESGVASASGLTLEPTIGPSENVSELSACPGNGCDDGADKVPAASDGRKRRKDKGSVEASAGEAAVDDIAGIDWVRDPEGAMRSMREAAKVGQKRQVQWREDRKNRVNKVLMHFHERGWAADQALSIYINSRFFPTAASRFRKFMLRYAPIPLADHLFDLGPSRVADEFLFPFFAEFCFEEFADEIRGFRELVNSADMTKPHTWFPAARSFSRRIIYHAGPTNSGKTHSALEAFKNAESGIYCGPLRLLAMEVFERVNADGVYCSLITGQERKEVPFARHSACTIEMANLATPVEVAVVDEIQMVSDEFRGWAWSRALLGLQASEIHVCGDPSAVPLLRAMAEATGDTFTTQEYSRFAPLVVDRTTLQGDLSKVQSGDCVVAFSRREIFELKRSIELLARRNCCVVYGALPPETRRQQALRFNDPLSDGDVLVASDAVGMGLNLSIRRIVFSTLHKFNGDAKEPIPAPMVKQIAGRAGRRGSRYEEGTVTCLQPGDLPLLVDALKAPVEAVSAAGLFPLFEQVELFASRLPEMSLPQLLDRFVETSRVDGTYFICRTDNLRKVASLLERVRGLNLRDRFFFCFAPANIRDQLVMTSLLSFAHAFADQQLVRFPPPASAFHSSGHSHSPPAPPHGRGYGHGSGAVPLLHSLSLTSNLIALEARHQVASLYLWLSNQFPREMFPDIDVATAAANRVATELGTALEAKAGSAVASKEWEELNEWRSKSRSRAPLPRHAPQHLHHKFQQMLTKTGKRKAAG